MAESSGSEWRRKRGLPSGTVPALGDSESSSGWGRVPSSSAHLYWLAGAALQKRHKLGASTTNNRNMLSRQLGDWRQPGIEVSAGLGLSKGSKKELVSSIGGLLEIFGNFQTVQDFLELLLLVLEIHIFLSLVLFLLCFFLK